MLYKSLFTNNNGLFIYSKYVFQGRTFNIHDTNGRGYTMFKTSKKPTLKKLEIPVNRGNVVSNLQERLLSIRQGLTKNFNKLGTPGNEIVIDKTKSSILRKETSEETHEKPFDLIATDVREGNPDELSRKKALSDKIMLNSRMCMSREDRTCDENKADKFIFANSVTENVFLGPKVEGLMTSSIQQAPSKSDSTLLNKEYTREPSNVVFIESDLESNPQTLNKNGTLSHKVRTENNGKFLIHGRMRSDRICHPDKLLVDTYVINNNAIPPHKVDRNIVNKKCTDELSNIIEISDLQSSESDILNEQRTVTHKVRLKNFDKFVNTGKMKSNSIKSEIKKILSPDSSISRNFFNSVTPICGIPQTQFLEKPKRSIEDRLMSIRFNRNLKCIEPVKVSAVNSAITLSLDTSSDILSSKFDSDLKLIENKMKNLSINSQDVIKENNKRILTHKTRMEVLKEFTGKSQKRLLKSRRPSQQKRYLSTSSTSDTTCDSNNNDTLQGVQISKTLTPDEELHQLREPKLQDTNVDNISELKKVPLECKHIEVKAYNEIQPIHEKFPFPKNIINSYYEVLSDQLKDKSLKLEAFYKSASSKQGTEWVCMYHLKWPENIKVSAKGLTKKRASTFAALKCLAILSEQGRISAEGLPLIYNKEEVKKLTQKKQPELKLDDYVIQKMQNIVDVFNDKMSPFLSRVVYSNYENQGNQVVNEEESMKGLSKMPRYLGMHQYLAKEKVVLPISKLKESFIELIQNNNCVIVKGEPGCGKSSRVPQYVLEAWVRDATSEGQLCRIAVTQPRRIAAISLAERVASERKEQLGHIVGYQVRLLSNFQPHTGRILYCTTGILLRHLQSDPNLSKFSHVILDEAHERDVNTDLLMTLMKKAINQNNNLKVVVMSATIDAEEFSEYFDGAPVFNVPGFTYPVNKHYLDNCKLDMSKTLKMCNGENPRVIHEDVAEIIGYLHYKKPEGAILTFLPGWEDLVKVQKLIPNTGNVVVYLVHSKLKDSEQHKIFSRPPPGVRKIILATNIAETSITIDDVVYVVDTGIHKDQIFDNDKGINIIDMEWISKASANQRAGRAGRCSPGESYHLYTQERFSQFPDYSSPKILNSSLTKIILDSKMFSNNMDACDFMNGLITPPEKIAVERAVDELKQLELLNEREKLTPLGKTLVNFQLEPNLAKVMVNAVVFKCTTPIVDIVTLFSSDTGIFGSLALTDKDNIKHVKSRYCKSSDHLALMRVYEKWLELSEEEGSYQANRFCRDTNLVPYKLQFVNKLREIHSGYLYNGLNGSMPLSEDLSDNDEIVKAVLYSGTGTVLQHRNWDIVKSRLKTNANVLVTRNNQKATITAESVNYKRHKFPSDFLVYINETRSNIRRTTIVRECSLIPPISVLLFSNKELEILKNSKSDNISDNQVIVGIKDTKLQFICEKTQAEILIDCKKAIDESYKYLIHQLTYAGEEIPEFLKHWDNVLINLGGILERFRIE